MITLDLKRYFDARSTAYAIRSIRMSAMDSFSTKILKYEKDAHVELVKAYSELPRNLLSFEEFAFRASKAYLDRVRRNDLYDSIFTLESLFSSDELEDGDGEEECELNFFLD